MRKVDDSVICDDQAEEAYYGSKKGLAPRLEQV